MKPTQEEIEKLRSKVPLEYLVRQHTELKPDGKHLKGKCPFCEAEETFSMSPEKQVYHCFNCRRSGQIFNYLQEKFHMSFPSAIQFLRELTKNLTPGSEKMLSELLEKIIL